MPKTSEVPVGLNLFDPEFRVEAEKLLQATVLNPLERLVADKLVGKGSDMLLLIARSFMTGANGGKLLKQKKLIHAAVTKAAAIKKVHPSLLLTKVFANGYQFVECRGAQRGGVRTSTKVARSSTRALRVGFTLLSKLTKKHDKKTSCVRRLQNELTKAYDGRDSILIAKRDEGLKTAAAAHS